MLFRTETDPSAETYWRRAQVVFLAAINIRHYIQMELAEVSWHEKIHFRLTINHLPVVLYKIHHFDFHNVLSML